MRTTVARMVTTETAVQKHHCSLAVEGRERVWKGYSATAGELAGRVLA